MIKYLYNSSRKAITEVGFGKFICFEGIDGSGKSTQIKILAKRLSSMNILCYETKEPTDSPVGSLIRQILTGRIVMDNRALSGLFSADRVDHLTNSVNGVCSKINSGVSVLMDRYYFSSYAYHGVDMSMDRVIEENIISAEILRPTVTIFLDIPVDEALKRIEKNRFHKEIFEEKERLRQVRDNYFKAFDKLRDVENVVVIDADADIETIGERIWEIVSKLYI